MYKRQNIFSLITDSPPTGTVQSVTFPSDEIELSDATLPVTGDDAEFFTFTTFVPLLTSTSILSNDIYNPSARHLLEVSDDKNYAIYTSFLNEELSVYVYKNGTWTLYNSYEDVSGGASSVSISSDGQYMFFTRNDYYGSIIYKSSDYGDTFTQIRYNSDEEDKIYVDSSDNGQYILFGHDNTGGYYNSGLLLSTDSGSNLTEVFLSGIQNDNDVIYLDVKSVSVSSTGQYMSVLTGQGGSGDASYKNKIYTSSDYGSSWTQHQIAKNWKEIKMSSGGQYQTAITTNDKIYVSSDFGVVFAERNLSKNWKCLTISSDGQLQVASSTTGTYVSSDAGLTWQELNTKSYDDISLSSTTLEAVGSTQPDGYTIPFEKNVTPKGYASQITNSHSDIIYDAPLKTGNTAFELVSSRDPVKLSSSSPLGYTVRLSPDGNTLGICDLNSSGNQRGVVKVYRWNGTTWNLIDRIQQEYHNDMQQTHFGGNIEFSNDGNIIAVAATGSGDRTGVVKVYEASNNSGEISYIQRGNTLHEYIKNDTTDGRPDGTIGSQNKFRRIAMSADGQYLAIGSPYYDDPNVTIYQWNSNTSNWDVIQELSSERDKRFGFGLALSQDGQQLVIMENDALRYYQKENGLFDEKWSIISDNNSDFSNMVNSLNLSLIHI